MTEYNRSNSRSYLERVRDEIAAYVLRESLNDGQIIRIPSLGIGLRNDQEGNVEEVKLGELENKHLTK